MKTETTIQANPKIQQSEKSQCGQYATYKPSNVEWLGDVPSHWKVTRIKDVIVDFGGDGFPIDKQGKKEGDYPFLKVSDINSKEDYVSTANNYATKADIYDNKWKIIPIQSMITAKVGEALKKNHRKINEVECCIDNNLMALVIDNRKKYSMKYFLYLSKEIDFDYFEKPGTVPSLNMTLFRHYKIPQPKLHEQTAIAAYLDQATANIDKVIATKQKQLEKLEQYKQSKIHECVTKGLNPDVTLKPSGIDWIGDVPGHWKVERIKDVATVVLGKMLCSEDKGSYFLKPYLKSKNIGWNELLLDKVEEMWFSENELENLRVKKNDILMTEGGEVGKTSIWNDELEECYIQNSVHKITFDKKNNPRYYLYLLNHIGSFGVFTHLVSTVSIGHLTKEKLVVVKVVAPTLNEQNEIAKYLDDFCDKISKEKSIIEQQIEKLKQYRKCLIHECVTGKRKVIGE